MAVVAFHLLDSKLSRPRLLDFRWIESAGGGNQDAKENEVECDDTASA